MWMRFVERPEVELVVPFVLSESPTSARGMALLNKTYGGWTRFKDLYEMLKDLKGTRIPLEVKDVAKSNGRDVLASAYKDGADIYIWLNNREYPIQNTIDVNINSLLPKGKDGNIVTVKNASIKRMKWTGDIPYPHDNPNPNGILTIDTEFKNLDTFPKIKMLGVETCIIKVTLSEDVILDKVQNEEVFYAPLALLPANQKATFTINIPTIDGVKKFAKLGLGLYSQGGLGQNPIVKVNGTTLTDFDVTYSKGIVEYSNVEEMPIPLAALREGNNTVEVTVSGGSTYAKVTSAKIILGYQTDVGVN